MGRREEETDADGDGDFGRQVRSKGLRETRGFGEADGMTVEHHRPIPKLRQGLRGQLHTPKEQARLRSSKNHSYTNENTKSEDIAATAVEVKPDLLGT